MDLTERLYSADSFLRKHTVIVTLSIALLIEGALHIRTYVKLIELETTVLGTENARRPSRRQPRTHTGIRGDLNQVEAEVEDLRAEIESQIEELQSRLDELSFRIR